jgi:hypothetical protein
LVNAAVRINKEERAGLERLTRYCVRPIIASERLTWLRVGERAETSAQFDRGLAVTGGVNRWLYVRQPTPLDQQPVIRMNRDTDYKSGDEIHLEFAAMQHLSEKYALGIIGYHYEQINGDSGSVLGDFEGRVSAIGPALKFKYLERQNILLNLM